jgi:acetate kinase
MSSDMREVREAASKGDERCLLAIKMFDYRVKKYIGSYAAAMGGLDLLIFTGGVGENSDSNRTGICEGLEFLGIELDEQINSGLRSTEAIISKKEARVKVMVVPTNEELMIAIDTKRIIEELK